MARRGFFARASAAIVGVLAACTGRTELAFGAPAVVAPRPAALAAEEPAGFYAQLQACIDAQVAACPSHERMTDTAWDFPLPSVAENIPPLGEDYRGKPFTLRSWRAMTHPHTVTAEEKALAARPWSGAQNGYDDEGWLDELPDEGWDA